MVFSSPWYPMYADDFTADTYHLSAEAVGVYVRLMNYEWKNGAIPADPRDQASIAVLSTAQMKRVWTAIGRYFSAHPGDPTLLIQRRLEEERGKASAISASRSEAARSRWNGDAKAMQMHLEGDANAYASASANAMQVECENDANHNHNHNHNENKGSDATASRPRREPSQADLAAYAILRACYPIVAKAHPNFMAERVWSQRNKRTALDLHASGHEPEQCAAAMSRMYGDPSLAFLAKSTMLSAVLNNWARLSISDEKRLIAERAGLNPWDEPNSSDLLPTIADLEDMQHGE